MKSTIVGVVLALAFVGAMFAASWFLPHGSASETAGLADSVKAGFVGAKRIESWTLVCTPATATGKQPPIPFSLAAKPRVRASQSTALGRCHVVLLVARKENPRQVLMAINFRLTGPAKALTLIVRFPPFAKKGQWVGVRAAKGAFRVPVLDCGKQECLAAGGLPNQAQSLLFSAAAAELVFPAGPKGKHPALNLPLSGLRDAVAAMTRAES